MNTAYEDSFKSLSDMLKTINGITPPIPQEVIIRVINLCTNDSVIQLAFCDNLDDSLSESRREIFSGLINWLLSLPDVPDEYFEEFCHAGELLCASIDDTEHWLLFQQLRILFFIQTDREESEAKLAEYAELAPNDPFIQEAEQALKDRPAQRQEEETEQDLHLKNTIDFLSYIDCLKKGLKRYTILIAARDTPWGPGFTQEYTHALMSLGLEGDLYGAFRCGYIAAIDCGERWCEILTSPDKEAYWSGKIGNINVHLKSRGYNIYPMTGIIEINGQNYACANRGLAFVVYDKEKGKVIDRVAFDTYSDSLNCSRPNVLADAVKQWHEEHPEIGIICFNQPVFPTENHSPDESFMAKNSITRAKLPLFADHPDLPLRADFSSPEDIMEVITAPKSYHDPSGARRFEDTTGNHVNTRMGHRITFYQPEKYTRTIYLVGGCLTFGVNASDQNTIASWLQHICNEKAPEEHFLVQNYGYFLWEADAEYMEEIRILQSLPLQAGDIVICGFGSSAAVPNVDISGIGKRPHNYGEIFSDTIHLNGNGYHVVAEKLFEKLKKENFFRQLIQEKISECVSGEEQKTLQNYKNKLISLYESRFSIGAIVMNCNPFTLGHRYLIEQALKQCAHLVIFVVEEDLSYFPFEDRLHLVKQGTSDLKNVTVLPSGQFILSSLTFSEYFNKSELQERCVDASKDVEIFAKEIAPCLHITKRFVGEEPFDTVTKQYNEEMKKILPQYNITVIEIKRKELADSGAISASRVRKCIEEKDFESVRSMVPDTTYQYLITKYQ